MLELAIVLIDGEELDFHKFFLQLNVKKKIYAKSYVKQIFSI